MMSPSTALRIVLTNEISDPSRYFPATSPSVHKNNGQAAKNSQTVQNEAGEGSMDIQKAANEMHNTYTQVGATVEAVIDVTEEDAEGNTTTSTGTQEQSTYQQPNFRLAADNITPLIEQSKALEEKLRNGTDGHDVMHEVLRVLTDIRKLDPIRYGIEIDRLVAAENAGKKRGQAKFSEKKLEQALKTFAEREAAEILTKMTTVGEVWPDAPEEHHELPLPSGYKYSDDGVEKFVSTAQGNIGFEEVSSQPSYMAGWREDITTGEIQAVIRTRTRNRGWIEITCAPSDFSDKRKTADLRNVGCDFSEEATFGKFLLAAYTLIRTRFGLEPELGTSRLGWHEVNDQLFFVFPEQSFGAMPVKLMDDNPDVRTDFSVCGDLQTEGEALVSMMFKYEKLAFAVGIAAASVLMRPAKLAGLVDMFGSCTEYVSAGTNTGKSTTVQAAFSIYGDPHSVRTFQTTQFGATKQFILRSDLPSVWQEAQAGEQKARDNNADPAILLHILGDGGGKLMGTKSGGLRGNPRIYGTMLLANNEKFVTPATAKQGELQRIFSFDPPFPDPHSDKTNEQTRKGVKRDVEKLKQELSKHHGNGGREMVRMLIEVVGGSWAALKAKVEADFTQQYEAACKVIQENVENRSMLERRANMVALARVGLKYLIELGYGLPEQIAEMLFRGVDESFLELIEHETEQADTLIDSKKHKNELIDYVQSNQTKFFPFEIKRSDGFMEDGKPVYKEPDGGYLGGVRKKNGELWIGVKSQKLMELFAKFQRSHTTLISAWAKESKPFVLTDEKGKPIQKQGRIGRRGIQVRPNMYFFRFNDFGLELVDEHIEAIGSLPDDF
ncbi:DUF927 domain-containing protein [Alicyclobacillus curvatus]|nr:DUF927 domain-containing protein [Alicyclobacillus curvatus]